MSSNLPESVPKSVLYCHLVTNTKLNVCTFVYCRCLRHVLCYINHHQITDGPFSQVCVFKFWNIFRCLFVFLYLFFSLWLSRMIWAFQHAQQQILLIYIYIYHLATRGRTKKHTCWYLGMLGQRPCPMSHVLLDNWNVQHKIEVCGAVTAIQISILFCSGPWCSSLFFFTTELGKIGALEQQNQET